jgi:Na+:H+ antiporter, NhaA family
MTTNSEHEQGQPTSGLLLMLATACALVWANSAWSASYARLWQTPIPLQFGGVSFERTAAWFVNDGLMVVFFFVVGLEIRREIHAGELSHWRRASLPVAAALGGMIVPAGLYLVLVGRGDAAAGWGVPMATDIAFAVGVLALLGKRVPAALRVLLLALAVIDDLGAIVVIAIFYSSGLHVTGLIVAAAGLGAVMLLQRLGVRAKLAYVPLAVLVWASVYAAGVHPTIAGVALGLLTPVRALPPREAVSPADSLIDKLQPWVEFAIMPIFALANAGVTFGGTELGAAGSRVLLSVIVALALGKPTGVLLACWLSVRTGLSRLPTGVTWRHIVVLGAVAGIGFTMALFVAQLAFQTDSLLSAAKLGVLAGSGTATLAALLLGRALLLPTVR